VTRAASFYVTDYRLDLHSFPTRRSSDLPSYNIWQILQGQSCIPRENWRKDQILVKFLGRITGKIPLDKWVFVGITMRGPAFASPRRGTLSFVTQKFFCFGAINNRRNNWCVIPLCRHSKGWCQTGKRL